MLLIKHIIDKLGCLEFIGDPQTPIKEVMQLNELNNRHDVLFWCNDKNIHKLSNISFGTVICSRAILSQERPYQCNLIIVDNPRLYFSRVVEFFFYSPVVREGISKSAVVHSSSVIGANCYIGENVVIEENCIIGDNCLIDHNTVLHHGTVLGEHVKIGCNNTIGGFGYGYEKNEQGEYKPIPHLGNVVIESNVEICNNTTIDRAALGSTLIGKNVKISNLVHIGHGVIIGQNSLIIANAMIAGSTVIGENVWISPSASIINKTTVGDNAVVGLSAVVIRPVENHSVVIGNPAKMIKKTVDNQAEQRS